MLSANCRCGDANSDGVQAANSKINHAVARYADHPVRRRPAGARNRALLERAIGRADFCLTYGGTPSISAESIVYAAVAVASGIVLSHPFVDGNKRTALMVVRSLLNLNEIEFAPPREEIADAMVKLASGEWSEGTSKTGSRSIQVHATILRALQLRRIREKAGRRQGPNLPNPANMASMRVSYSATIRMRAARQSR